MCEVYICCGNIKLVLITAFAKHTLLLMKKVETTQVHSSDRSVLLQRHLELYQTNQQSAAISLKKQIIKTIYNLFRFINQKMTRVCLNKRLD